MPRTVVLDDHYLKNTLLRNATILQEFPFLQTARNAVNELEGCATCQRDTRREAANRALQEAKRSIGSLPLAQRERLKQILGVTHARVSWAEGEGVNRRRRRADL